MPKAPGTSGQYRVFVALVALPLSGAAETVAPMAVTEPLDEIVTVAHKSERRLRDIAANVTVLDRESIERNLSTSMGDVFRYTPGIDAEGAGHRFGTEGLSIRGIGGNRVAVLIDGVPLGDQFDIGNFANATRDFLDAGLIQRIEVLRGPASALYGSSAIGGVVAARTLRPQDVTGSNAFGAGLQTAWHDADRSVHGTGMLAAGTDRSGVLLAGSLRDGNAVDSSALPSQIDGAGYQQRSALLTFVTDDASGRSWSASALHHASDVDSDLKSMLGSGRFASTTALKGTDAYKLDLLNLELGFGAPEGVADSGVLRVYVGKSQVDQLTFDERGLAQRPVAIDRRFLFEQEFRGIELNLQKDITVLGVAHGIGTGLEYREERTEELRQGFETGQLDGIGSATILGETFPLRDFPVSDTGEWGAYLEDTVTLGGWTVIAALRADRYELSVREDAIFTATNPSVQPVSLIETDLSPKLGLVYRVTDRAEIYLQYARGFRAPPFEDANIGLDIPLFNVKAIPNPDLRSETSDGMDVGLRWSGDESHFHIGIFSTNYTDFIETRVSLGPDPVSGRILFQSQNLNRARIQGLEAGGGSRLPGTLRAFSVDGALYMARGDNKDNGEPLNSVGPAQAVLGLTWSGSENSRRVRLQTTVSGSWSKRDETAGALFQPPGYALFDLYMTQGIGERATVHAGLMNLADRTWWKWSGVRGLAPNDPILDALAQPGRSLTVGLNIKW